ncbi:MAG: IS3 family transposase [Bacteroidales bacterium]|nr:IS3 family transposase [Bacteroidales bacterium]
MLSERKRAQAIQELRPSYPLPAILEVSGMARSTFYYHKKRFNDADKYESAKKEINAIFHKHRGRYGYRRITLELCKKGFKLNHKTVSKLMAELGIKSEVRKKKYRSYRGEVGKTVPNILERNFKADKPNQKWATDVTEFSLLGTKLYLSPIIDLYNGEIVSYNIAQQASLQQTMNMIEDAFCKIPDNEKLILHSDQGWQYRHHYFQHRLQQKGVIQSMSRKGNCLDNAVIENFFGILKSELLYLQKFDSVEHFHKELDEYMKYYNNDRIKLKLNGMSPVQYRTHH